MISVCGHFLFIFPRKIGSRTPSSEALFPFLEGWTLLHKARNLSWLMGDRPHITMQSITTSVYGRFSGLAVGCDAAQAKVSKYGA